MPHITHAHGPTNAADAEALATARRLEQEHQALQSRHEHAERRAEAVEHERTGTPANAEQDRLRAQALAERAERRKAALAQARGEAYEPHTPAVAPAPVEDDPDTDDGPTAA